MREKRLKWILIFVEGFLAFSLVMVFRIVATKGHNYMENAVRQRKTSEVVKEIRGKIYDRNMISFVDSRTEFLKTHNGEVSFPKRYDSLSVARHIIGSVRSDGKGMGGLEEMYDHILSDAGEIHLISLNDCARNPINEFSQSGIEITKTKDASLLLSLDYHIQKIAETELEKSGLKGAVCIMEVNSFNPLAIADRGNFDQNNVGYYLNSNEGELVDRATSPYDAGSIFKIVTTAAVLEDNIVSPDYKVNCTGSVNIGGTEFLCHKKEGHGEVNMEEAFSKSCNVYFYKVGNMAGIEKIYNMAKRFSLGEKILNLWWEREGSIDILSNTMPNQIANISIGQGNLLLTPLQAVNMVNIIANDGREKTSNLVLGIVDAEGIIKEDFRKYEEKEVIKKETASLIKKMMRQVVVSGTGKDYNTAETTICAKTGTAETGWSTEKNETMTHGWFVGFFPMENPRYSISVFLEDGKSSYNAGRIFENITKELLKFGY